VGTALGLAILVTVAATHADTLSGSSEPGAEALVAGYRIAFFLAAGVASLGAVAALCLLRKAKAPRKR
jgi:hypothetical protein